MTQGPACLYDHISSECRLKEAALNKEHSSRVLHKAIAKEAEVGEASIYDRMEGMSAVHHQLMRCYTRGCCWLQS